MLSELSSASQEISLFSDIKSENVISKEETIWVWRYGQIHPLEDCLYTHCSICDRYAKAGIFAGIHYNLKLAVPLIGIEENALFSKQT